MVSWEGYILVTHAAQKMGCEEKREVKEEDARCLD